MSTTSLISLILMTALFLVWVVLMIMMLLRLTRRSLDRLEETGGGYFTWVGHSLATFFAFFTSQEDKAERRRLLFVTALLFIGIVTRAMMLSSG